MSPFNGIIEEGISNPPNVVGEDDDALPRREVFISIRTDNAPGSGTKADLYNGSTDTYLDSVLDEINKNPNEATVKFGPGVF